MKKKRRGVRKSRMSKLTFGERDDDRRQSRDDERRKSDESRVL